MRPRVLCELYSVITNPRRVAEPCSPTVALQIISALLALPGILVATMFANNIKRIYTFNVADFAMFPELSVVLPAAQLEQEQGS